MLLAWVAGYDVPVEHGEVTGESERFFFEEKNQKLSRWLSRRFLQRACKGTLV